ncbi:MAG: FG-GAP repeat protein [Myxococcota bacterium]
MLAPPDTLNPRRFGDAITVDGDLVVIGAPISNALATNSGAVYVYRYTGSNFEFLEMLLPDPGDTRFGEDLAISGQTLMVASEDSAVYFFDRSGDEFTRVARLARPAGLVNEDRFANRIALAGNVGVANAALEDEPSANNSGALYVYRRQESGEWMFEARLTDELPRAQQMLGVRVTFVGNLIAATDEADQEVQLFEFSSGTWSPRSAPELRRASEPGYPETLLVSNESFVLSDSLATATDRTVFAYRRAAPDDVCDSNMGFDFCDVGTFANVDGPEGPVVALNGDAMALGAPASAPENGFTLYRWSTTQFVAITTFQIDYSGADPAISDVALSAKAVFASDETLGAAGEVWVFALP